MRTLGMPSEPKLVRCAIYTRVSTEEQTQREYNSLETQADLCRHAIALHKLDGWVETSVFSDPGYSGKNMDRPGFQQLMGEIRAGAIDVVVVYKIDRFTRSIADFYGWWELLKQKGVNFVSASQQLDTTTPTGMLMLNMLLSFGQFEREQTAERVAHKMAERAKKGKWNGGHVPVGYTYDKDTKLLVVDPEDAKVVNRVFQLTVEKGNQTEVAKAINAEGIRSKMRVVKSRGGGEKSVGGKRFIGDKVKRIVTNPIYKGVIGYDGAEFPGEHQGIVSESLWKQANEALAKTEQAVAEQTVATRRANKHEQILKGLLFCEECGFLLTPKPGGKKDRNGDPYLYYVCNDVAKDGQAAECSLRNIPARPFENFIIQVISEMGRHPDVIGAALDASNRAKKESVQNLKAELGKLNKRHQELSGEIKKLTDLAKRDGAAHLSDELLAEAEETAKSKHEVEVQQEKLKLEIAFHERAVADERLIAQALLDFGAVFESLTTEEQMELLELVIRRISVRRVTEKEAGRDHPFGSYATKLRTSWFLVTIQFHTTAWFTGSTQGGGKKFVKETNWRPVRESNSYGYGKIIPINERFRGN